jgi:hypothetical protein
MQESKLVKYNVLNLFGQPGRTIVENGILLDTTSQIGVSGQFMALVENRKLDAFQALWEKISVLRQKLGAIEEPLSKINDLGCLLQFANRCRKRGQDFSKSLTQKARRLEINKAVIQKELSETYELVDSVQPGLGGTTYSLARGAAVSGRRRTPRYRLPAVASRNSIIQRYKGKSVLDTCKALDSQEVQIPLPTNWTDRFLGVKTWTQAYMNRQCRNLVHKMISKARADL